MTTADTIALPFGLTAIYVPRAGRTPTRPPAPPGDPAPTPRGHRQAPRRPGDDPLPLPAPPHSRVGVSGVPPHLARGPARLIGWHSACRNQVEVARGVGRVISMSQPIGGKGNPCYGRT
ncbi:hypothetical protein LAUMK13_01917 [Mycobacterium innocens]|uniref:Uncharacterized protein n=1 Tax=Mycobacterium innocens TaxID=2341083 RepID=A0A498PZ00_9MYCO|nr:hypothetical protein LAUMK13_01917 [Mycobacterium innocens]